MKIFVEGKYRTLSKKNGSLSLKLTTGKDWRTGGQIQREYTGKTAEEILEDIERSRCYSDEELGLKQESITVTELMEEWLEYKDTSLSQIRIEDLRGRIRSNILQFIGDELACEIDSDDLEDWILELDDCNCSTRRIKLALSFLNAAFEYGIRNKRLVINPCRELRKIENVIQNQPILNEDQIKKLLITEKDHPYMPVYALMLGTGMRTSEALGLSWKQIDNCRQEITVSQQLSVDRKSVCPTKNRRNRTFPIPDWIARIINIALERQQKFIATIPKYVNELDLVFSRADGRPLSQNDIREKFRDIMRDTSCPTVTCHALRRTFASFGAEMGYIMGVQHVLGHADISTTVKYIYPVEGDARQLVQMMDAHYGSMLRETMAEITRR